VGIRKRESEHEKHGRCDCVFRVRNGKGSAGEHKHNEKGHFGPCLGGRAPGKEKKQRKNTKTPEKRVERTQEFTFGWVGEMTKVKHVEHESTPTS